MSRSSDLVRPELLRLAPYNAGLTLAEVVERYAPERIAKLGSNESPLGPSPRVAPTLAKAIGDVRLYPDPASRDLRDALGARFGFDSRRIMIGNGSEDLLAVLSRATLRVGDRVVTPYPSFPLHEDYAILMGASVDRVPVRDDLTIDVAALAAAVSTPCKLLILANPMNPVGSWLSGPQLAEVLAEAGAETLIVVDEAYAEYAAGPDYPSATELLRDVPNRWIVLRTFSKAYGLAGLRVGYAVFSDSELCALMDRVRTPFNVNVVAQAAALAALGDDRHLADVVSLATSERARMHAFLTAVGVPVAASKGNFLFFGCGRASTDFAEELLRMGVVVKPWKQPGYERFARVSVGSPAENDQFMEAASALLRSVV